MSQALRDYIGIEYEFHTEVCELIDEIQASLATIDFQVNRETITADKDLALTDQRIQHIITSTASLNVNLPTSPVNGTQFLVKNSTSSSENLTVNSVVLTPGDIYEVVYDGTEWVVL